MELNRSQLAEHLGVDLVTVDKWRRQGCPFEKRGRKVIFALDQVFDWRIAKCEAPSPINLDEARKRKLSAEAEMAELELARERGEVVEIEDVAHVVGEEYAACRARLLSMPTKLAPLLATVSAAKEARAIIERAVVEALDELSSGGV